MNGYYFFAFFVAIVILVIILILFSVDAISGNDKTINLDAKTSFQGDYLQSPYASNGELFASTNTNGVVVMKDQKVKYSIPDKKVTDICLTKENMLVLCYKKYYEAYVNTQLLFSGELPEDILKITTYKDMLLMSTSKNVYLVNKSDIVEVYKFNNQSVEFGKSLVSRNNTIVVSDSGYQDYSGCVYVLHLNSSNEVLTNVKLESNGVNFGKYISLDIYGKRLFIVQDDTIEYYLKENHKDFKLLQRLSVKRDREIKPLYFGKSMECNEKYFVVSEPRDKMSDFSTLTVYTIHKQSGMMINPYRISVDRGLLGNYIYLESYKDVLRFYVTDELYEKTGRWILYENKV